MEQSKEEKIKEVLAKNPIKTAKIFTKLFNLMDGRCKQLCMTNPSRPMSDYCEKCQEMFKKLLGRE